jgi:hypothetical protein
LIPAYSALSAIANISGSPIFDIVNNRVVREKKKIDRVMIASYAFGETYGNLILSGI